MASFKDITLSCSERSVQLWSHTKNTQEQQNKIIHFLITPSRKNPHHKPLLLKFYLKFAKISSRCKENLFTSKAAKTSAVALQVVLFFQVVKAHSPDNFLLNFCQQLISRPHSLCVHPLPGAAPKFDNSHRSRTEVKLFLN